MLQNSNAYCPKCNEDKSNLCYNCKSDKNIIVWRDEIKSTYKLTNKLLDPITFKVAGCIKHV